MMGVFMVGRMAWMGRGWLGFGDAGAGGAWCRRLVLWCCFQGCSSKLIVHNASFGKYPWVSSQQDMNMKNKGLGYKFSPWLICQCENDKSLFR